MFAIRQIIEDPQDVIPVPPEFRNRRTEVIFLALDQELEQSISGTSHSDVIDAFRGKGKGDSVAGLLMDRQSDREKEV